jgi:hypothetical protein
VKLRQYAKSEPEFPGRLTISGQYAIISSQAETCQKINRQENKNSNVIHNAARKNRLERKAQAAGKNGYSAERQRKADGGKSA